MKQQAAETFCKEAVVQVQAVRDYLGDRQRRGEDFNPSLCSLDHALWCLKTVENMVAKTPDAEQMSSDNDPVNHPAHYKSGSVECIDAIESALTPEEFRGYCKGNMLKYIWRERHKGGDESIAKARWYLNRLLRS
jgi:hypothetical protein